VPRWKDFELLAKQICDELDGSAEVTWDDHIMGHQTQIPRQIDVSIKWDDEGTSRLAVVQAKGLFNLERATGNLGAFSASSAENPWPPEVWMLRSIRTSEGPRAWSRVTGAAVVAPRSLFVLVVCCSSGSARSLASMQSSPGATASR